MQCSIWEKNKEILSALFALFQVFVIVLRINKVHYGWSLKTMDMELFRGSWTTYQRLLHQLKINLATSTTIDCTNILREKYGLMGSSLRDASWWSSSWRSCGAKHSCSGDMLEEGELVVERKGISRRWQVQQEIMEWKCSKCIIYMYNDTIIKPVI